MIRSELKWMLFNSITAFIAAYLVYFHGAYELIATIDATYMARVIGGAYIASSLYLGYGAFTRQEGHKWDEITFPGTHYGINFKLVSLIGLLFVLAGIGGTAAGMMLAFHSMTSFDPSNISTLLVNFFEVGASAPVATLFGLGSLGMLYAQVAFVFNRYED